MTVPGANSSEDDVFLHPLASDTRSGTRVSHLGNYQPPGSSPAALYILPTPSATCRTRQEGPWARPCTLDRLKYHKHVGIYLKNTREPQSRGTRAGRVEPMTLNIPFHDRLHLGPREAISPYLGFAVLRTKDGGV